MVQHVAGAPEVSEPVTARLSLALGLAGSRGACGAVVTHDVVLCQLAGGLLPLQHTVLGGDGGCGVVTYREI